MRRIRVWTIGALALASAGCGAGPFGREEARPVVVAATGEPSSLLPPLAVETVARDIGDLVFERLADLAPGAAPIDSTAYRPRLASRWERLDSLTWRFRLRPGARWADGRPVTAADVVFSFEAFADSLLDSPARPYLAGRVRALAEDSGTVRISFREAYPEQLFDATYHVRVIPRHVWGAIPRDRWAADTAVAHLAGSGPYEVTEWKRGQFVRLRARPGATTAVRAVVWRFAADPDAALNLVLGHEADLMELVGPAANADRVAADPALRVIRYPSAAYGFLGFNLARRAGSRAAPALADRATRRALAMAVDRAALAPAVFGPGTAVPPGPMSRLLWIWSDSIRTLPYDTAAAVEALERAGWRLGRDLVRRRGGVPLGFDILVPATSPTRRDLALGLQEAWRRVGARVTVTAVDFPVFQERLRRGQFDAYIGAWLDEPTPRGLADQWTRAGWDGLNYGHYANPAFDSLLARAAVAPTPAEAARLYRAAMDTLNADAPAIFLYSPAQAAAVSRRLEGVTINPYEWLSGLPSWTLR